MLVAALYVDDGPNLSITPPTGWTLAHQDGTTAFEVAQLYYHQAGSSEPGSYVWTSSRAGGISGIIAAYTGVAGVEVSAGQTGTSMKAVAPSVNAANAGDWLVGAWTAWNSNVVLTPPTGMTQRRRFSAGDPLLMADKALLSSGATQTQRASTSAPPAFWTGQVLVLHARP